MDTPKQKMSESGQQFAAIFEEHHDPIKGEERKIKENRKKRSEMLRLDAGL